MEYFVYCKIRNQEVREGIDATLKSIAASVYTSADIIFIDATNGGTLHNVVVCLQDYLKAMKLDKEDIIYVFYPQDGKQIGMYPFKTEWQV